MQGLTLLISEWQVAFFFSFFFYHIQFKTQSMNYYFNIGTYAYFITLGYMHKKLDDIIYNQGMLGISSAW